ncbi:MAG: nucleoside hydrolase [Armatimonadota bacterium]
MQRIPVILDTDIGGDIDDTWALAMLLRAPEVDVKLVVTDTADTVYRAKVTAKLLQVAGRADIPVGIGIRFDSDGPRERQALWISEYELAQYPGVVREDGVQALIETIMGSPEPVTLICIGPVPNIAEALRREPRITENAHFVGMHGSMAWHHRTNLCLSMEPGQIPEYNVMRDVPAAQAVLHTPWRSVTITPVDTCAWVVLDGERYARLRASRDPLVRAVLENYDIWSPRNAESNPDVHSSVLFDTVAIHLAYTTRYLTMKQMKVRVDDEGFMREDPAGVPMNVAIEWEDLPGYLDELTARVLGE